MDDLYLGDIFQIPMFDLWNITLDEIINKFDYYKKRKEYKKTKKSKKYEPRNKHKN